MDKRRRPGLATLVAVGLLIGSGVALADPAETEVVEAEATDTELIVNTLFSFGYDLINGFLLWNLSSIDQPCALPTADDGEEEPDSEEEAVPDCELSGGEVAGPNGQINHGMFMKLFNSMYQGSGRGCVVRHLARSELGKGDQQVKVGDDSEETGGDEVESESTIEFTSVETLCQHGPGDDELEGSNGNGNGKPPWAGKPEGKGKPESPDKSASAPGKNK